MCWFFEIPVAVAIKSNTSKNEEGKIEDEQL